MPSGHAATEAHVGGKVILTDVNVGFARCSEKGLKKYGVG